MLTTGGGSTATCRMASSLAGSCRWRAPCRRGAERKSEASFQCTHGRDRQVETKARVCQAFPLKGEGADLLLAPLISPKPFSSRRELPPASRSGHVAGDDGGAQRLAQESVLGRRSDDEEVLAGQRLKQRMRMGDKVLPMRQAHKATSGRSLGSFGHVAAAHGVRSADAPM